MMVSFEREIHLSLRTEVEEGEEAKELLTFS